jgi:hypothetical protein
LPVTPRLEIPWQPNVRISRQPNRHIR